MIINYFISKIINITQAFIIDAFSILATIFFTLTRTVSPGKVLNLDILIFKQLLRSICTFKQLYHKFPTPCSYFCSMRAHSIFQKIHDSIRILIHHYKNRFCYLLYLNKLQSQGHLMFSISQLCPENPLSQIRRDAPRYFPFLPWPTNARPLKNAP